MDSQNDVHLYKEMRGKNQAALEKLYSRYEKLVYSFAYRMTGSVTLSEDVVQDVFMKLWNGKGEYDESKGKFSSWLLTVTRYTAVDHLRKVKQEDTLEIEERDALQSEAKLIEDEVAWQEERALIHRIIKTLNIDQQKIVNLFYFKGYSQQQISESCNIPLGTVKGRIRLALKHLRTQLEGERGLDYEKRDV